jgi:hypothetical protein
MLAKSPFEARFCAGLLLCFAAIHLPSQTGLLHPQISCIVHPTNLRPHKAFELQKSVPLAVRPCVLWGAAGVSLPH